MMLNAFVLGTILLTSSTRSYDEIYRPQFHFTAATNWLNDPNGLVFYKGTYHLFFQHNPIGIDWGNMTWGHATSPDLVHWTQLPDAIKPDDMGTIFSGSAVVDRRDTSHLKAGKESPLIALYTSAGDTSAESKGKPFSQCLAFSSDAGTTWEKYRGNPVIPQIAHGNRDPKVVWFEPKNEWVMALYLEGADYALLTSPDLIHWAQIQRFSFPGAGECPDFFEMPVDGGRGSKWVFVSASGEYLVGSFDGQQFRPEQAGHKMDAGPNFYAVQTYSDIPGTDGRRIQIAWMNGGKYPGMPFNQQMSFPCALTLHQTADGYRIDRNPVGEIRELYHQTRHWKNSPMPEGKNVLANMPDGVWDLTFEVEVGSAKRLDLGFYGQRVTIDVASQTLRCGERTAPLAIGNGRFKLRALIDRTSFELFGNAGELSFSACYLPALSDGGLSLTAVGGNAVAPSIEVHSLKSAWH